MRPLCFLEQGLPGAPGLKGDSGDSGPQVCQKKNLLKTYVFLQPLSCLTPLNHCCGFFYRVREVFRVQTDYQAKQERG